MKKQVQYLIPAAVVVNSEEKILMVKKSTARTALCVNRWEIPGGTLKFGEKFKDGLKRKIKEYIGVDIEVGEIIPYVHSNVTTGILEGKKVEMQFYIVGAKCRLVNEQQQFHLKKGKIKEAKWFSQKELLEFPKDEIVPGDLEITKFLKDLQ